VVRARCLLVALTVLAAGAVLAAQDVPSSLVLVATAGDYPGETYTAGPAAPAEFVFFEGEAVAVDVSVANWSAAAMSVRLPAGNVPAVRANLLRGGRPTPPGRLRDSLWRETVDGSRTVPPLPSMSVEPGDALRWRVIIETSGLAPDFYAVQAQTGATGDRGEAIRRQRPEFTFELRARSAALPAELARRVAEQLTADGDAARARAATEVLERIYPDSVAVHLIRSRIAEAEGNEALARRELNVAAAYMRAERDTLFRQFARPGQIEDLIDSLRF
jgi:hypothetical protein